jgi:hypothetical protein
MKNTLRWLCSAGAILLICCSILLARQGVVRTDDGRTIEGDIDDSPNSDTVTVSIGNAQVAVERSDILSIEYGDTVAKQFAQRLAELPSTDIRSRLELARWALDKQQYDLARQAADQAMRIDPGNPDAQTLLDTIQAQQNLSIHRTAVTPPVSDGLTGSIQIPPIAPAGNYLSDDEVNLVRQSELRSEDVVRVTIDSEAAAQYLRESGQSEQDFASLDPMAQAWRILEVGDPKLSAGVKILSDPAALDQFHRRIEPRILVGCASAGCHGDAATSGDFYLYHDAQTTPQWFTNFYILQMYQLKIGSEPSVWGKGTLQRDMIDRAHPSESILLQFALPRAMAQVPHPDVNGWRPLFTGTGDPSYQEWLNWIGQSLVPLDPNYGFTFALPTGLPPATQPAAAP